MGLRLQRKRQRETEKSRRWRCRWRERLSTGRRARGEVVQREDWSEQIVGLLADWLESTGPSSLSAPAEGQKRRAEQEAQASDEGVEWRMMRVPRAG